MSLKTIIDYILAHNESVIQWLIVTIIVLTALLIFRSLFSKGKKGSVSRGAGVSAEQVESILSKVLEKTKGWEAAPTGEAGAGGAPPAGEVEAARKELAALKASLTSKEAEITKLKTDLSKGPAAAGGAAAAAGGADVAKYVSRIEELEGKLAEYAVLEDDIADLSLYKEENSRLKGELERLKGGVAVDPGALQVPEPAPSEDLVKEFAEAVGKETKEEAPVAETAPATTPTPEPVAASAPEALAAPEPVAAAVPEVVPAPVEAAPAGAPAAASAPADQPAPPRSAESEALVPTPPPGGGDKAQGEVDDLFAELASSDLDTDRVVSELAALEALGPVANAEEALGGGVDPDKILAESGEQKA